MLSIGLVGLPNVGKSSLFNALVSAEVAVSNYPFTTIDSNVGVVPVPDERLEQLRALLGPQETTPSLIQFIDIAGLVEGASQGEGLGNQFLGEIRQVDAVVHVLRCYDDGQIAHVSGSVDPVRDAAIVEQELRLADQDVLAMAIEKRRRTWKADPRAFADEEARLNGYLEALETGRQLRLLGLRREDRSELKGLGMLTSKPIVWAANVSEDDDAEARGAAARELRSALEVASDGESVKVVPVSARLEAELAQLDEAERREFMEELGLQGAGLDDLVGACFGQLDLIRFYTVVNQKLRAWALRRGSSAVEAAGKIHSDMATGFIRAQVIATSELLELGGLRTAHQSGRLRTEGRDYEVQDGDLIEFAFRA